jgi:hypothetical protein
MMFSAAGERSAAGAGSLLQRVVHRAKAAAGKRSGAPSWTLDLARVVEDLREMNRVTEADFLAVGEKLMGFLSAARQMRADISQLANFISGDSGERACGTLARVLHHSLEMKERVEEASRALGGMGRSAAALQRCFAGFHEIGLFFQVAATLGRVETARLGGSESGLGHLAAEVRSCTETIQARVEDALQSAAGLQRRIDLAIRRVSERDLQQLQTLPSLVGAVEDALTAFRSRQERANVTSESLSREFAGFSEAIHGLVEAIQFHDITRQQAEHVIEALDRVLRDSRNRGPTARPSPAEAAVAGLQRQQLLGAAKTFASSVQRIRQELAEAAARGQEMEAEAKTLLGLVAEDQQSSFFAGMERCFAGVLKAVESCAAVEEDATGTTADLQRATGGLQSCLDDIRMIWLQVNRLALNAAIEAIHLGPVAEPLSVVAGSLQNLYAAADRRSDETSDSLAALRGAILSLVPAPAQFPASTTPPVSQSMVGDLRTSLAELGASSERSLACSRQISGVTANLCADVRTASDSFTAGKLVEETMRRSCDILESIAALCQPGPDRATGGLDHLAARYTMQAERDVHARTADPDLPAGSDEELSCGTVPAGTEDLGDGTELF